MGPRLLLLATISIEPARRAEAPTFLIPACGGWASATGEASEGARDLLQDLHLGSLANLRQPSKTGHSNTNRSHILTQSAAVV